MTTAGVQEYIEAIRGRYVGADKTEKGRILDEAVRVSGYHRKAVVRMLGRREKAGSWRRHSRCCGKPAVACVPGGYIHLWPS